MRIRRNHIGVVKEKFEVQPVVGNRAESPADHEIDVALVKFTVKRFRKSGHKMKHDAWIALGEPINQGGNKARCEIGVAPNSQFTGCRIGEKLNILHAPAQFVEYRRATIKQRLTVRGRLDALSVTIEQAHTQRAL